MARRLAALPVLACTFVLVGAGPGPAPPPFDLYLAPADARSGRRLIADWETPDRVLLAVMPPDATPAVLDLAHEIVTALPVVLLTPASSAARVAVALVAESGLDPADVRLLSIAHDTPWVRDFGPIQVEDGPGHIVWLDARYAARNGRDVSDGVPQRLGRALGVRVEPLALQLDGGGLVTNGRGLCVVTRASASEAGLVGPDGAPARIRFFVATGCRALLAVPGLPGESTQHADTLLHFTADDAAILAEMAGEAPPGSREALERTLAGLEAAAAALGQRLRVARVPMLSRPLAGRDVEYRSWVNGLRAGSRFFAPHYHDVPLSVQAAALRELRSAMPGVTVAPVPMEEASVRGGAVHCMTLGLHLDLDRHASGRRQSRPPASAGAPVAPPPPPGPKGPRATRGPGPAHR